MFGAIEAGGTKFVCAIGDDTGRILDEARIPTTDPISTVAQVISYLQRANARVGALAAVGVASFGPLELDRNSKNYGHIGKTPKAGWTGTDIIGPIERAFACPVGFDTDVNAAALAENRWGAAKDVDDVVYVTVGTGIGGGVIVNRKPIHGLMHPEIGHIFPRKHPVDLNFIGVCPFHGDCLEGVASGPAIIARSGAPLSALGVEHPQWEIEADYLGQMCAQLVLTLSPKRIILGGGVLTQTRLLALIRVRMQHWLRGYVDRSEVIAEADQYVVAPALGLQAGVIGGLALAMDADGQSNRIQPIDG